MLVLAVVSLQHYSLNLCLQNLLWYNLQNSLCSSCNVEFFSLGYLVDGNVPIVFEDNLT